MSWRHVTKRLVHTVALCFAMSGRRTYWPHPMPHGDRRSGHSSFWWWARSPCLSFAPQPSGHATTRFVHVLSCAALKASEMRAPHRAGQRMYRCEHSTLTCLSSSACRICSGAVRVRSKCSQARATVCTHPSAPQPFLHVTRRWLHSSASWRWIREKGPSSPHSHLHFAGRCEQSSASWRVRWARNISSPQPALHLTHRRGHTLAWASCSSSGTLASQPAGRRGGQARARHRACQGGRTNRANRWPLRAAVQLVLGQLSEFARHTTPVLARPQPVRALVR